MPRWETDWQLRRRVIEVITPLVPLPITLKSKKQEVDHSKQLISSFEHNIDLHRAEMFEGWQSSQPMNILACSAPSVGQNSQTAKASFNWSFIDLIGFISSSMKFLVVFIPRCCVKAPPAPK